MVDVYCVNCIATWTPIDMSTRWKHPGLDPTLGKITIFIKGYSRFFKTIHGETATHDGLFTLPPAQELSKTQLERK
jgi:hypothetical protein